MHGPQSRDIGASLRPRYILYQYMDPLGFMPGPPKSVNFIMAHYFWKEPRRTVFHVLLKSR